MAQAKMNDTVAVHYTGSFTDGVVFDSSIGREPLEFTIGQGMVIPGFENNIIGMHEGDLKTFNIPAEEAYGLHREDLTTTIERSQVPASIDIQEGMMLQMRSPDGSVANVIIREVGLESVTLDLNHPMAGKDLIFEINLIKVA